MSPAHTSDFEATADVWTVRFDGVTWSGTGPRFERGILPRLTDYTPQFQGRHIFVDEVAERVMDSVFPEGWTKLSSYRGDLDNLPPPNVVG